MHQSTLKRYMTAQQQHTMGLRPTLHMTCLDLFKVARPGKTAKDKANGHIPYRKNRRVKDTDYHKNGLWIKV